MTAYNRENYIAEAIESVLQSEFQDWELIIVDDCSKDRTVEIARSYAAKDSRISLYVNEQNLGDYGNRNKAASYARGKYLKSLDSDDYFLKGGLAYCVRMMEENPTADWAISYKMTLKLDDELEPKQAIKTHFFQEPFLIIGPEGTVLKRSFFEQIGGYPEKYGPANDMYFNLNAATQGKTLLMREDFLHYRIHEGQEINNKFAYLHCVHNYLRDALKELNLPISRNERKWLRKKMNRKFVSKLLRFAYNSRDVNGIKTLLKKTGFTISDAVDGLIIKDSLLS